MNPKRWSVEPVTPELTESLLRQPGPHVVFVGGGFGELQMIERVANELREQRPNAKITYCLRDPSTMRFVKEERSNQPMAMWPFDFLFPVSRWLKTQQPDVLVFTERFRFTTFSCAAAAYGAGVGLMNGRCRFRDNVFYKVFGFFYRWQFSAFRAMAMQREDYYQAAHRFARKDCEIRLTGDIKTDLKRKEMDPAKAASLERWLCQEPGIPIIAAGSTGNLEEERMVLDAYRRTREKIDCRLLLAPRKVTRREEVLQQLKDEGFTVATRTQEDGPADIYMLDTLGELAYGYRFSQVAYVGGAYGNGGGHNVMEPLEWGVPVSYGMSRGHFEALQRICEEAGVGTRIKGSEDLSAHWIAMLTNDGERERIGAVGRKVLEDSRGAVQSTIETILPLVDARTTV